MFVRWTLKACSGPVLQYTRESHSHQEDAMEAARHAGMYWFQLFTFERSLRHQLPGIAEVGENIMKWRRELIDLVMCLVTFFIPSSVAVYRWQLKQPDPVDNTRLLDELLHKAGVPLKDAVSPQAWSVFTRTNHRVPAPQIDNKRVPLIVLSDFSGCIDAYKKKGDLSAYLATNVFCNMCYWSEHNASARIMLVRLAEILRSLGHRNGECLVIFYAASGLFTVDGMITEDTFRFVTEGFRALAMMIETEFPRATMVIGQNAEYWKIDDRRYDIAMSRLRAYARAAGILAHTGLPQYYELTRVRSSVGLLGPKRRM